MRDKEGNRNKRWLWRCADCQKLGDNAQYTVRVGTVMEDSPILLRQWCHAFWRACSSKKGVSAKQIEREVGVSNKTALYMMHRIRWAMAAPEGQNDGGPLTGTVEADECYIGGKTRYKGQHPTGRPSPDRKAPVLAMVERGGHVRVRHVADVSSATLKEAVLEHVSTSARFMTDEYASYRRVNREFEGGHHTVSHKTGEYARGDVSSNTVESFFAILKRGVNGTFHSISREHLHRYLSEFEFRYNTREVDDGARTVLAIQAACGKRLTYKQQVEG